MLSLPDYKEKQLIFVDHTIRYKLQFSSDNLVIRDTKEDKIINQISCYRIFAVFIVGDISITTVLMRKADYYGFSVVFLTRNFNCYAMIGSQTDGNVLLRKKQYDSSNNFAIAQKIVYNKLENQIRLLKNIRSKVDEEEQAIEIIRKYQANIYTLHIQKDTINIDSSEIENSKVQELLGIEGYSSKVFFQTYYKDMNWKGRKPRVKHDELNVLLDIGYTFLFNFIEAHLRLYGFDLYCGVYHTVFYQRKSLVCDLVEPFRCIIDHSLRKAYNLGQIDKNDFKLNKDQYYLDFKLIEKYTKIFFMSILEYKVPIFEYVQSYYRFFMKEKHLEQHPFFEI